MIIEIGQQEHLNSIQVRDELLRVVGNLDERPLISDRCAVTIASWFQSSGYLGKAFLSLSTCGFIVPTLEEAISTECEIQLDDKDGGFYNYIALVCLSHWVEDKRENQTYLDGE